MQAIWQKFIDSELSKVIKFYSLYCFTYFLFNVLLVSVIAFFHFLLEHDMSIVEDWVYRNSWEILIFCKISAFVLIFKLIELRIYRQRFFINFFKKGFTYPNHYIFVVILFICTFILAVGKVTFQPTHTKYSNYHFVSYLGSFFFYFIDYILLFFLKSLFPFYKRWEGYTFIFLSSFIFFAVSVISIPHIKETTIYLLFHMMALMLFTLPYSQNWIIGFCYIFFLVAPLSTFIGLDPIWSGQFSLFFLKNPLPFSYVLAIWLVAFSYQYYIRGKRLID